MGTKGTIETIELDTAEALVEALRPTNPRWMKSRHQSWIFRGHFDAAWVLRPTAFRPECWARLGGVPEHAEGMDLFELDELVRFALALDSAGLAVPGGISRSKLEEWLYADRAPKSWIEPLLEVMALAQHHGFPTRLLDVTYHSLVAAYFAAVGDILKVASEPPPKELCVWAIDAEVIHGSDPGCRVLRATRAGNPNLIAQDGAFVVWEDSTATLEGIVHATEVDPYEEYRVTDEERYRGAPAVKMTLPREQAVRLLGLLARERVTGARLFPGPEGIIRYRYEQHIHEMWPPDGNFDAPKIVTWRRM
jgi:hypothetical protein